MHGISTGTVCILSESSIILLPIQILSHINWNSSEEIDVTRLQEGKNSFFTSSWKNLEKIFLRERFPSIFCHRYMNQVSKVSPSDAEYSSVISHSSLVRPSKRWAAFKAASGNNFCWIDFLKRCHMRSLVEWRYSL